MCVVGYNDQKSAYKIFNSWGTEWGDSGYGWIEYKTFRSIVNEAFVAYDARNNISEVRDRLLIFTGSDWCEWSAKLRQEVFAIEKFQVDVEKYFEVKEIDFPKKKQLSESQTKRNQELATKYQVRGFPTIVLLDGKGRQYAITGYVQGGPDVYLAHLLKLQTHRLKREEEIEVAYKASGHEMAKLLDRILMPLYEIGALDDYQDMVGKIIESDMDNKVGLKKKWSSILELEQLLKSPSTIPTRDTLAKVNKYIQDFDPEGAQKQKAYVLKASVLGAMNDREGARAAFKLAHAADPNSQLGKMIENILTNEK